jgi:hypothetical protein
VNAVIWLSARLPECAREEVAIEGLPGAMCPSRFVQRCGSAVATPLAGRALVRDALSLRPNDVIPSVVKHR